MKPLSSITFIRNNIKKALPSFICTMISVFLVYLFGVLLYGSVDSFNKTSTNIVEKGTIICTNSKGKSINDKILTAIKDDSNVNEIIPMLGMNNCFNYQAVFGSVGGINSIIVYSEDVNRVLKELDLKLISGRIPENNANEIILPEEFVKQYKLKLGQTLNNYTNDNIRLEKSYKLVGVVKGNIFMPIVCDVGETKRDDAEKIGLMYSFKNKNDKSLNNKIDKLKDKSLVVMEYKGVKEAMDQSEATIDALFWSLSIVIIIVLVISLSNLNYIIFINRKNEFSVLNAIGVSKARLRRKLFYENTIICIAGYIAGICFTILVTQLLNTAIWNPDGKSIPIFRLSSMLVALIIPIVVSLMSVISSIKEFKMLGYENLNN